MLRVWITIRYLTLRYGGGGGRHKLTGIYVLQYNAGNSFWLCDSLVIYCVLTYPQIAVTILPFVRALFACLCYHNPTPHPPPPGIFFVEPVCLFVLSDGQVDGWRSGSGTRSVKVGGGQSDSRTLLWPVL